MSVLMKTIYLLGLLLFFILHPVSGQVSFTTGKLAGTSPYRPTSLQFGPDGKLYVSTQDGLIYRYTVQKTATGYQVMQTESISLVKQIPNRNDDGTLNAAVTSRQITGILVSGTASAPKLYVTSSDPRIGGAGNEGSSPNGDGDVNLDTNSGILSLLTWNGTSWSKTDLVRGLPRSEENHAQNGMTLDIASQSLYITSGGMTNAGSPSVNFAMITEYALAACVLKVDLNALMAMPVKGTGNNSYVYDLPTLDDPTRSNSGGQDLNDPFGGNDGLNQAKIVSGGPVQVFSPGHRNMYDIVLTKTAGKAGRLYGIDNGANPGWGGYPDKEGTAQVTNKYVSGEPGSLVAGVNDAAVNNLDNLHLIYSPGTAPIYGGHPVPVRANPGGAGLFWKNGSGNKYSLTPTADWPPVPLSMANPVEADFRNPGVNDGAITTFYASTNGITEYTATTFFNGQLTGDLLTVSFDGNLYRLKLSDDGKSLVSNTSIASGFANIPLDVTAQGDGDVFPGSIWVADYMGNSIHFFEPAAGSSLSWSTIAPSGAITAEKRHENAFVACGGKMYLMGGRGIKVVNIFDPSSGHWNMGAPIPGNKELHHFQAVSIGNDIYILNAFTGFYPSEIPVPDIYIYHTASNSWTIEYNAIPLERRRGSSATVAYEGKIYMAGGIVNGHNNGTVNWTDVYDPVSKKWTILSNAPHLRDHVQGAVINGKIYLAGGRRTNALNGNPVTDTEGSVDVYDIAGNVWTTLPSGASIPLKRAGAAVVELNGKLYVIGGESSQSLAHKEVHVLDPASNSWSVAPSLNTGRHGTQATVFQNSLYIASGSSTQGGSSESELNTLEKYGYDLTCPVDKNSYAMDDDQDGFSNKDEIDAGSDPCSAASKPKDADGDKISDLNDPDDDNDGIPDTSDVFYLDAKNGTNVLPPLLHPFLNGVPGTGLFGIGFTGLMSNGTDPGKLFNESANGFIMGGAVGLASVPASSGSPLTNNQQQAFQMGFLPKPSDAVSTVEAGLIQPYFNGVSAAQLKDELHGMYVGTGDQDNYVLVAITPNFGNPGILILQEINGVASSSFYPVSTILTENLSLFLDINPTAGTIQPKYKKVSDPQSVSIGLPITVSGKLLNTIKGTGATAAGILASARTGNSFSASWDFLKLSTTAPPSTAPTTWRINTGGGAVQTGGFSWNADGQFTNTDPAAPSQTYSSSTAISNTTAPVLYQSERYGKSFSYKLPLPNGIYTVNLHFAEIFWTTTGKRIFNVNMENGQGNLSNYDILTETGPKSALIKSFTINITDGELSILFTAVTDMAKISAIEVLPFNAPPPPPPPPAVPSIRINTGGPAQTLNGQIWEADKSFSGTSYTYSSSTVVSNTSISPIYQSERYGNSFSYSIPVTSGQYQVTLHFAEIFWTSTGSRLFNVNVENGQGVLSNFDIFALAGKNSAVTKSFPVNVTDGQLNIAFTTVKDNAKISGIEIMPLVQTAARPRMEVVPEILLTPLEARLTPNPFNSRFVLTIQGGNGEAIDVHVMNTSGQVLETIRKADPALPLYVGERYPSGLYFVEIRQAKERIIRGIMKQ